jgi:hypothetical protein
VRDYISHTETNFLSLFSTRPHPCGRKEQASAGIEPDVKVVADDAFSRPTNLPGAALKKQAN